jgi:hypothetical protein
MEFAVRALRGWAAPYVIPVASAFRVFDSDGRITDEAVELQLRTLGAEVVRVATRFVATQPRSAPGSAKNRPRGSLRLADSSVTFPMGGR